MTPEEEVGVQTMNDEIASLLQALNKAHRGWVIPRLGSASARVSTYIAFKVLARTFHLDDMPVKLRDAADRLAGEVVVRTGPASEVLANTDKVGKA